MAEETSYPNLAGKRVSTTFRGLLHLPHSIPNTLIKQTVYDGQGTPTALTLGADTKGVDISGPVSVSENITIGANCTILSSCVVASDIIGSGNITLVGGGNINDVVVLSAGSTVSVRSPNTAEVGKLRIRESVDDHELLFGNPDVSDKNLFSIIVKKDTGNNLYIKNNYGAADSTAPLWINRATGEVNIKTLKVTNIATADDPSISIPSRPSRNSNTLPVGMISMFPALVVPTGWFACNGGSYSKITYPELFAYLGYAYGGSGDSFNVPDYRNYFLRAWSAGRSPGTTQQQQVQTHKHVSAMGENFSGNGSPFGRTDNNGYSGSKGGLDNDNYYWYTNDGSDVDGVLNASGVIGSETRPVNIAVAYCIKW